MRDQAPAALYAGPHDVAIGRTDGVLSRRLFAYGIDLVAITMLAGLFGVLLVVASVVTLGLTVPLFALLWPATAILYNALTVGGSGLGTFGMRLVGLAAVDAGTGGPVGFLMAGMHALMFYVGIGTLLLLVLDLLVGFAREDRRLGHDLLAGLVVIRR